MLQIFLVLLLGLCSSLQSELENSAELVLEEQPNVQISGGDEAKPHDYPYMVKLRIMSRIDEKNFISDCGGSLISKKYILTAAHCLVPELGEIIVDVVVILGAHNWKSLREKSQQEFHSTTYVIHKGYSLNKNYYDDIALIELPTKANITKEVDFVKLPKRVHAGNSYVGEIANLTGWGRIQDSVAFEPAKLRVVAVKVKDSKLCGAEYRKVLNKQICTAGSKPINKSSCVGDSGGPLVINGTQIGIVSYGIKFCETPGSSSIYTKVDQYLDWIALHSDVDIN